MGPLCASQDGHDCKPAKVRPAGKHAFEDDIGESFVPLAFVFDEPRNKAYALAFDHGDKKVVFELPLDGSKLTRTTVLDAPSFLDVTFNVDASGTLRTYEHTEWRYWTVHTRNAKGEMQEPTFLPFGHGKLALAGPRGLSIGDHEAWETNDSGDTWVRVPSNGFASDSACDEAGCVLDNAERIGWDLPALTPVDVLHAQKVKPEQKTPEQNPVKAGTPVKVACKASGKSSPVAYVDWTEGSTLARWAHQSDSDFTRATVGVTWGSKDAVHHVSLMPAVPKRSAGDLTQVRTAQEESDNGMIAARYRFTPRTATGYRPVNVELAWWSAVTGQVHRSVLSHVKPFRVSRFQFSGTARIVDGGLVFRGRK